MTSSLLINEPPLQVLPTLAHTIGLNEAIFLQQLHYWMIQPKIGVYVDNCKWVRNTINEWKDTNFPFWSRNTINRIVKSLETKELIITRDDLNKLNYDKTKWYTVNYAKLRGLHPTTQNGLWVAKATTQNGSLEQPKLGNPTTQNGSLEQPKLGNTIPETTQTTHSKKTRDNNNAIVSDVVDILSQMKVTLTKTIKTALKRNKNPIEYLNGFLAAYKAGFYNKADDPAKVIASQIAQGNPPPVVEEEPAPAFADIEPPPLQDSGPVEPLVTLFIEYLKAITTQSMFNEIFLYLRYETDGQRLKVLGPASKVTWVKNRLHRIIKQAADNAATELGVSPVEVVFEKDFEEEVAM